MSRGRSVLRIWMLATLAWTGSWAAAQEDPTALFREGNRLYQEGDFEAAAQSYRSILDSGLHSAPLHYNLGNAEFKSGNLGLAVLHYERALRLSPGDEEIEANLALAYSMTADEITPRPRFWLAALVDGWLFLIPLGWLIGLTAFFYLTSIASWTGRILARSQAGRTWTLRLGLACLVGCALFGATWAGAQARTQRTDEGVVLASEVVVRSAPSEDPALTIFEIHEGTKVTITERAGEWSEVMLADGKVGWVKSEAYETI